MSTPSRYQPWTIPILNGRVGYAEPQEPDPDPDDPTNYASSTEGAAVQVALLNEIVEPADDFNLTVGTVSNDARNTHNYTSPTLAQDDDDATRALRTGFAFLGTIRVGLQSDLGSAQLVSAMTVLYLVNSADTHPTIVEHSPDGSTWTVATGTWTGSYKRTFVLDTPTSARYWAARDTEGGPGFAARSFYTWATTGSSLIISDPVWNPAPQANDGDTGTSAYSSQPTGAVLRVALAVARQIYRIELDVGQETAGATVYEFFGSDDAAFTSPVLLGTLSFTATGTYSLDTVTESWLADATYQYFQLEHVSGGGDDREFYEIRLFSAVAAGGGVTVHGDLSGRDDAAQHPASSVTLLDAAGWFTATDVEAGIAELAAKSIGYQAHGNLGTTETFDAAIGWHSGTLNDNCTFTLTAAPTGTVSSLFLELAQDGTGGRTITLPASVINKTELEADQDTTLSSTSFLILLSRDGGTTWYGGWGGGGSELTIEDEGTPLATAATTLDFVGAGVVASGATGDKTITISGAPTGAAGGDLSGTYPNPDVVNDSHTHTSATVTMPTGLVGPILITDTPAGSPLIFGDLLQDEDGTDLLYADV